MDVVVAGVTAIWVMTILIVILLFICFKRRHSSCCGCQKGTQNTVRVQNVSDIPVTYRHSLVVCRESDHDYALIANIEARDSLKSQNKNLEATSTYYCTGEKYLDPRNLENETHELGKSQFSDTLKTSFSCLDRDDHLNRQGQWPRGRTGRRKLNKQKAEKDDLIADGGDTNTLLIPQGDKGEDGQEECSRSQLTDSMADVLHVLFKPENRKSRHDLLEQLKRTSLLGDSTTRRFSRSLGHLNFDEQTKEFAETGLMTLDSRTSSSQNTLDEVYYSCIDDFHLMIPDPKQSKSDETNKVVCNTLPRSQTVCCSFPGVQQRKQKRPIPSPRSRSGSTSQASSTGILKRSDVLSVLNKYENENTGEIAKQKHLFSEFPFPSISSCKQSDPIYVNHTVPADDGSLKRSARKVRQATRLDGRAAPTKQYPNVRMVVKNMSCSVEDIGLESQFWNS